MILGLLRAIFGRGDEYQEFLGATVDELDLALICNANGWTELEFFERHGEDAETAKEDWLRWCNDGPLPRYVVMALREWRRGFWAA